MNAPSAPAAVVAATKAAAYELIPLARIDLSQTPMQKLRRERFDKVTLAELSRSIAEHGVLQPVLVRRRATGKHELVAGERRYLASKTAGLDAVPAILRDLDDLQVVEMQVIENNQREDLHPLIEAEGFEQLMKTHKLRAEDIAVKIGKSKSHVYSVLKYCDLCPEARRAFFDGKLNPSTALLIARIGHHDTQRAAMKDITEGVGNHWNGRRNGVAMSYRDAYKHIVQNYMLKLKAAPFDINDAKLLPKAGTCQACPKRTGNQRDLFGDVKDADVCTDPKCFDDKRQAHQAVARKKLEDEGHKVIHGAEAKKIMPGWDSAEHSYSHNQLAGGYVKLDDTTYASGRSRKVSEILGPDHKPTLIQHPGSGKILKVATQQAVSNAVQRIKGKASTSRSAQKPKPAGPDFDELTEVEVYKQLAEKIPAKLDLKAMRTFLASILDRDRWEMSAQLAPALGITATRMVTPNQIRTKLQTMNEGRLGRLLVICNIADESLYENNLKTLSAAAKPYKVDVEAIRKKIEADHKAKTDAASKKIAKAPKTAAKKKPIKK